MKPKTKNNPLVSFIVLSYKNYQYIYETIDSVLSQDYPNIELIISNDGSNDFIKTAVISYIKKNKTQNIKNFIVNNNKINLGTVKNVNKAIKLSHGKYIMLLAADDVLYNDQIISKNIEAFESLPKKELIVISQVHMYDINLKRLIQPFISNENKQKIKSLSPQELFSEMSTQCILPGCGICYKKEIFKKYGYFDEKYKLVEDYASALKFSRLGIRYNYFDFVSCKHRDGGISHGNINGESHKSKQYELDILNILKYEVYPYIKILSHQKRKDFIKKYKDYRWRYLYNFVYKDKDKAQRRRMIKNNLKTILYGFFHDFSKDCTDQFRGRKIKLLIIAFFCYLLYLVTQIILFKILWFLLAFLSIGAMFFYVAQKYTIKLIHLIKYII